MMRDVPVGPVTLVEIQGHMEARTRIWTRLLVVGACLSLLGGSDLAMGLVPGLVLAAGLFSWERFRLDEAFSRGVPSATAASPAWIGLCLPLLALPSFPHHMAAFAATGIALLAFGQAALRHDLFVARAIGAQLEGPVPPRRLGPPIAVRLPRPAPATPARPRRLARAPEHARCAICAASTPPDHAWVKCPVCDTPYHAECWSWGHGCAVFGCSGHSAHGPAAIPKKAC